MKKNIRVTEPSEEMMEKIRKGASCHCIPENKDGEMSLLWTQFNRCI